MRATWIEMGALPRWVRDVARNVSYELLDVEEFPEKSPNRENWGRLEAVVKASDIAILVATRDGERDYETSKIEAFAISQGKGIIIASAPPPSAEPIALNLIVRGSINNLSLKVPPSCDTSARLDFLLDCYAGAASHIHLPVSEGISHIKFRSVISASQIESLLENQLVLSQLKPREFEELVAELLTRDGWKNVEIIAKSNQHGPDIIAYGSLAKNGPPAKMIVECKTTEVGRPVGIHVVRNMMYWVNQEFSATCGMIATTSRFTRNAAEEANLRHRWRLDLKDGVRIQNWLMSE